MNFHIKKYSEHEHIIVYDKGSVELLSDTFYAVEAFNFEQHTLLQNKYIVSEIKDIEYVNSKIIIIGETIQYDIVLSISFYKLYDVIFFFYYPTSQYVNYKIIDEWLTLHGIDKKCDAQNFQSCVGAIEYKTRITRKRKKIIKTLLY